MKMNGTIAIEDTGQIIDIITGEKTQCRFPMDPQPESREVVRMEDFPFMPGHIIGVKEQGTCFSVPMANADRFLYRAEYERSRLNIKNTFFYSAAEMSEQDIRIFVEVKNVYWDLIKNVSYTEVLKNFPVSNHARLKSYFEKKWDSEHFFNPRFRWKNNPAVWVVDFELKKVIERKFRWQKNGQ